MFNFFKKKPKPISREGILARVSSLKPGESVIFQPEEWTHLIPKENVSSQRS